MKEYIFISNWLDLCHSKLFCSNGARSRYSVYGLPFICIIYGNPDPQYHPHVPHITKMQSGISSKPLKKNRPFQHKGVDV